jgi:molybdopterin/thiamine biosynthesis adenylyltransferase
MLARLGIGYLTVIDGDVFEPSNLNRQLLSNPENIGEPKAREAKLRVKDINPEITTVAVYEFLSDENAEEFLKGHDLIMDALDNIKSRRIIEKAAEKLNTPLIFGAIAGWYAQVCTIMPGDRILERLYPEGMEKGAETHYGNPSFTPALAASIQVAEAIKVLLNKGSLLRNKVLSINLLNHEYQIIEL